LGYISYKTSIFLRCDFKLGNGTYDDNSLDVVTILAVLEHIEIDKLNNTLKEFYRILKPNGLYILTIPVGWTDFILRSLANLRLIKIYTSTEKFAEFFRMEDSPVKD